MKTIAIQAYEDPGHPAGGHAILALEGLTDAPANPVFRLRPIDQAALGSAGAHWIGVDLKPVGARVTAFGLELVLNLEAADIEQLMPGTAMELELPAARVRGEFLWPNVQPAGRPKRRNIVVTGARPASRPEATATAASVASAAASPTPVVEANVPLSPSIGAADASPPSPAHAKSARTLESLFPWRSPAKARPIAVAPAPLPSKPADTRTPATPTAAPPPRTTSLRGGPALATMPTSPERPDPAAAQHASPGTQDAAEPHWYASARGGPATVTSAANATPAGIPQGRMLTLVRIGGAAAIALVGIYLISKDQQQSPAGRATFNIPAAAATAQPRPAATANAPAPASPPSVAAAASAPSPPAPALPASVPARAAPTRGAAIEPGGVLYDSLSAGAVSPRGTSAVGVSASRALELANAQLLVTGPLRDTEEGAFWLKRYFASTVGEDRSLRALTQLGSLYAEPTGRAPDFVKARGLWEIAGAAGDPVALCFLGLLAENGLGVAADRAAALQWYERSKQAGGCPGVDDAIVRTRQ